MKLLHHPGLFITLNFIYLFSLRSLFLFHPSQETCSHLPDIHLGSPTAVAEHFVWALWWTKRHYGFFFFEQEPKYLFQNRESFI